MIKKLSATFMTVGLLFVSVNASVYKGHALFQKKCLSCHGKALEFVLDKDTSEWAVFVENKGDKLLEIHLKSIDEETDDDVKALKYFNGKRFPKHVRHYKDFLFEYAGDTGNIPACD